MNISNYIYVLSIWMPQLLPHIRDIVLNGIKCYDRSQLLSLESTAINVRYSDVYTKKSARTKQFNICL